MIVTARARWLIAVALVVATYGLSAQNSIILSCGLACLIWISFEWFAFRVRVDLYLPSCVATRQITDRRGATIRVLWQDRTAVVQTSLRFRRRWWLPSIMADVRDLTPTAVQRTGGDAGVSFLLGTRKEIDLQYELQPHTVGSAQFAGLRFVLTDVHQLFHAERFIPLPRQWKILPIAAEMGTPLSVRKQNNALPPPGIHTLARAGVGSELLDIRDYVSGDSPRSIAWKISARRDALMCKQFESEVPVRCRILVDMSPAVRLGYPGPSSGNQLVSLAATIARTLTASRDPVAICSFDGHDTQLSAASASRKSVVRMVNRLVQELDRPVSPVASPPHLLMRQAIDVARIRYPIAWASAESNLKTWFFRSPAYRARVRLSAVLANHARLGPYAMGQLVVDDGLFSKQMHQFLSEHQAPYTGGLFSETGEYLFDARAKIQQLAHLITRSLSRGRDNELFVIMAELTDAEYDLSPLIRAIKIARARHHRVMVVAAWPPGIAVPPLKPTDADKSSSTNPLVLELQERLNTFQQLRTTLGKLRVPVVAAGDEQAALLVLNQLEVIRTGRFVT